MTLDANQYRDPMLVLEAKQEAERRRAARNPCNGCIYKARMWGIDYCEKDKTDAGAANMRRCASYTRENS